MGLEVVGGKLDPFLYSPARKAVNITAAAQHRYLVYIGAYGQRSFPTVFNQQNISN